MLRHKFTNNNTIEFKTKNKASKFSDNDDN